MKRAMLVLGIVLLCLAPRSGWADSIDELDAKRRNVPVAVVQLERAKERQAALEKQVAALENRVKELTAETKRLEKENQNWLDFYRKEGTVPATMPTQPMVPAIAQASPAKVPTELQIGMTLEEAKDVMKAKDNEIVDRYVKSVTGPVLKGSSAAGDEYAWTVVLSTGPGARDYTSSTVTAWFKGGKLTSWHR